MRYRLPLFILLALTIAGSAAAQTNLAIVGGALFPFGDFGDTSDISPYIGARYEIQDVNALGKVATTSYLIYGGYAFLLTSSDWEALVGTDENGSYFDIGLGARVHSKANGLFAGVGAGYVNFNPAGVASSSNGLGLMVGLGLATNMTSFKLELEGRGNVAFMEGSQTITSVLVLLGIGFPF
jgi:hypothetical protein